MNEPDQMDEEEEEKMSARERWATDEQTIKVANEARKQAKKALEDLIGYCENTTDPMVARMHASYLERKDILWKLDTIQRKTGFWLP